MKFRKTTQSTLSIDLKRFATYLIDPEYDEIRIELATWLNDKLDELRRDDFFGTEGQCDPRGDSR